MLMRFSILVLALLCKGVMGFADVTSLQEMRDMIKTILIDNEEFQRDPKHDEVYFKKLASGQHPRATVVGCADSRVQTINFDIHPIGDVFFIRNIGNQFAPNAGSVDYGVLYLHTPLLLFLGHSECGAVKAVTQGTEGLEASVRQELAPLHVVYHTSHPTKEQLAANIADNVQEQVNKACEKYQALIDQGKLWVVGGVYDFTLAGKGKLKIIQVNDQTDAKFLQAFLEDAMKQGNYSESGR